MSRTTSNSGAADSTAPRGMFVSETIEEELARTIAGILKIRLTDDTTQKLERRYAVDPEAHRLYLKAGSSRSVLRRR